MNEDQRDSRIPVAHIITKLELGGAQINTIFTYQHFPPERFKIYLLSGPGGMLTDQVAKTNGFNPVSRMVREINPIKDFLALLQIRKILKGIHPRIVHTHSSKAGILGRLAARMAGVPIIVHTVHGFSFSPHQGALKRGFYRFIEKLISKITTHIIFVSNSDMDTAQKEGLFPRQSYSLIRSGFPMENYKKSMGKKNFLRRKYNIKPDNVVCGIVAPFKPQKGLFHLVEIAERVLKVQPETIFFVAGDGALRESFEGALLKKGIWNRFRLPGFLPNIYEIMEIFDVGITTALWEGLPQSLVQMRLKSIPVVASDIPGNREVIRDSQSGFLVDVTDYEGFAQKVLRLIVDPNLRQQFSSCPEDFSKWDANFMVRAQEELYRKLIESSHS